MSDDNAAVVLPRIVMGGNGMGVPHFPYFSSPRVEMGEQSDWALYTILANWVPRGESKYSSKYRVAAAREWVSRIPGRSSSCKGWAKIGDELAWDLIARADGEAYPLIRTCAERSYTAPGSEGRAPQNQEYGGLICILLKMPIVVDAYPYEVSVDMPTDVQRVAAAREWVRRRPTPQKERYGEWDRGFDADRVARELASST